MPVRAAEQVFRQWRRPDIRGTVPPGSEVPAISQGAVMTTPEDHSTNPILRPGVRVIVIDDDGRTLLFASTDDEGKRFWFPPGGGTEPGETAEETAYRELQEETGLSNVVLAGEIGRRHVILALGWHSARLPGALVPGAGNALRDRYQRVYRLRAGGNPRAPLVEPDRTRGGDRAPGAHAIGRAGAATPA